MEPLWWRKMAKRKKTNKPKGTKITLKMAQDIMQITPDGKRSLDLSFKEITEVPKCIRKMLSIDELNLSRNFREVPEFIDNFISICILDLHSNYLEVLPVTIGRLQNLLILNLCNNRLTSVPSELGLLKKLHTLYLGLNQLDTLPTSIGALKELRHIGLADNRFTCFPMCLSRLTKLENVVLDRNPVALRKPSTLDSAGITESFYLVKESSLCPDCLKNCQDERKMLDQVVKKAEPRVFVFNSESGDAHQKQK